MRKLVTFDTLDKKPHLYGLAGISLAVLAAGIALAQGDPQAHALSLGVLVVAYLVVVIAYLLRTFVGQLRYNPYSYNTIYYLGFALFTCAVLANHAVLLWRIATEPGYAEAASAASVVSILASSACAYMLYSAPFILTFSCALCVSNVSLMRHEGYRPVNALGIVLGLCLVGGEIFLFNASYNASDSEEVLRNHDLFVNIFAALFLYVECMVIGAIVADVIAATHGPDSPRDVVIVLGCGLTPDGTPTPLLAGRCDAALAFAQEQEAAGGPAPAFVCSGGQGLDEACSEAEAMARYLAEHGIAPERIVLEDRSTTTRENMRYSKQLIEERFGEHARIGFATTNYHVFRSGLFARRVKMRAEGIGAPTKWYFWPNAAVREFVGLLTEHRGKQALVIGGLVAVYAGLTLAYYAL